MDTMQFQDLYRSLSADVLRFAQWLCGNRHDAEDLAAEAFVRAYAGSDAIEASTVKGYLLAIVRNLFLEQQRKRRPIEEIDAERHVSEECPTTTAEGLQTAQRLSRALARLGEPERSALLLRIEAELPYEEIAQLLGLSLANAKVKVHRARLKLAALLEENA
jgi:RNA polymerase sigma-70 factor (ECF subfamily)